MTGHGGRWAFQTALSDVRRPGRLRCRPGVEAAQHGDFLWVSGSGLDAALFAVLAACADGPVYMVDAQNRLIPYGHRVPVGCLPVMQWQPLARWLEPELPVTRIVSGRFSACPLTLVRTADERPASVLVTTWDDFETWSADAAEVRLPGCQFAVCVEGERRLVCVRGRPLPPLRGTHYWTVGSVAVPCGFTWFPAVDADILPQVLGRRRAGCGESIAAAELLIWNESGGVDVIQRGEFLPALRTHVRATTTAMSVLRDGGVVSESGGGLS